MQKRYVTRPKAAAYYDDFAEAMIDRGMLTVFERDNDPQPTGLLDADGNEFFSVSVRRGIGFMAREGWGG